MNVFGKMMFKSMSVSIVMIDMRTNAVVFRTKSILIAGSVSDEPQNQEE